MCYFMKFYFEKVFWDFYYKYMLKNLMSIPSILKIVVNVSCGNFFLDKNKMKVIFLNLYDLCLQRPKFINSKKSISEFKIRKNDNISFKVTLRKKKMYNFFYKIIVYFPSLIKNFNGFSKKSFDKLGNYNFGIYDFFSLLDFDENLNFFQGMNISIIFNSYDIEKSRFILNNFNFPFKNV